VRSLLRRVSMPRRSCRLCRVSERSDRSHPKDNSVPRVRGSRRPLAL